MENSSTPAPARVLTIAGSDPGGGAGIQADIKTFSALGCYAMAAITAVTVQDTTGVAGVHPIPAPIVHDQIVRVLGDIGADAVKIGMLHSAQIADAVADALDVAATAGAHGGILLVLDTVMIAKDGTALLKDNAIETLKARLIPRAALVTPNAPEAARLTGLRIETPDDLVRAGMALIAMGAGAALVTGGHLAGATVTDALVMPQKVRLFEAKRLDTRSTHGTGCTLASACAAGLAQNMELAEAVARAHIFVRNAIVTAPGFGHGRGPLNHIEAGKLDLGPR